MTSVWRCLCLYVLCLIGCSHATSIASFASSVRSASTSLESHAVASRLDRMQTSRRLGVHWNRFLLARLLAFVQSPLTYAVPPALPLLPLPWSLCWDVRRAAHMPIPCVFLFARAQRGGGTGVHGHP